MLIMHTCVVFADGTHVVPQLCWFQMASREIVGVMWHSTVTFSLPGPWISVPVQCHLTPTQLRQTDPPTMLLHSVEVIAGPDSW